MPLIWKATRFRISIQDHGERTWQPVDGWTAGVFGIHRRGRESYDGFILTHLPTGSQVIELRRRRACKEVAEELLALRLHLDSPDFLEVVAGSPDADKVAPLIRRYLDAEHTRQGVPS